VGALGAGPQEFLIVREFPIVVTSGGEVGWFEPAESIARYAPGERIG